MLGNERLSRVTWHCITRKVLNAQLKLACLSNRGLKLQLVKLCPHHGSVSQFISEKKEILKTWRHFQKKNTKLCFLNFILILRTFF